MSAVAKRMRVVDYLRSAFPGTWRFDAQNRAWVGPAFEVRTYAENAPAYDGDDRCRRTYRRSDTSAEVHIPGRLWEYIRE